jgi:hypothetical protein
MKLRWRLEDAAFASAKTTLPDIPAQPGSRGPEWSENECRGAGRAAAPAGIAAYPCGGDADFGAGFWDLIAGNQDRGARPRALVDYALATMSCDCECSW